MATVLEQLDAMRNLQPNWDGYNADPPTPAAIDIGIQFVWQLVASSGRLEDVRVYPGRAGGLLVEWSDASAEYEIELEADGTYNLLRVPLEVRASWAPVT